MKLLTKQIEKKLPALGSQDGLGYKAQVYVKYFNPAGAGTWLVTEYDPEQKLMFGAVEIGGDWELGYISLDELENTPLPLGMKIERDLYCSLGTLEEMMS